MMRTHSYVNKELFYLVQKNAPLISFKLIDEIKAYIWQLIGLDNADFNVLKEYRNIFNIF